MLEFVVSLGLFGACCHEKLCNLTFINAEDLETSLVIVHVLNKKVMLLLVSTLYFEPL